MINTRLYQGHNGGCMFIRVFNSGKENDVVWEKKLFFHRFSWIDVGKNGCRMACTRKRNIYRKCNTYYAILKPYIYDNADLSGKTIWNGFFFCNKNPSYSISSSWLLVKLSCGASGFIIFYFFVPPYLSL